MDETTLWIDEQELGAGGNWAGGLGWIYIYLCLLLRVCFSEAFGMEWVNGRGTES